MLDRSQYEGEWLNDKKNGKGVLYVNDGTYRSGTWKDGVKMGDFSFINDQGVKYQERWKDGRRVKNRKSSLQNEEILENQRRHYKQGFYLGKLVKGKMHGSGNFTCFRDDPETGLATPFCRFEGEFNNGKPAGTGILFMLGRGTQGCRYEGQVKGFSCHGRGTVYYEDGRKECGEFLHGRREGNFILFDSHGKKKFEGVYKDGEKNGYGVYTYSTKSNFEGEYVNGKRHGPGIFTFSNGDTYKGEWRHNRKHGKGFYTYASDGRKVEAFFANGRLATKEDFEKSEKKEEGTMESMALSLLRLVDEEEAEKTESNLKKNQAEEEEDEDMQTSSDSDDEE